ncbi:ion transporter [Yunchengibacter salinarum]|uniref:ion transporter n=1 Tax=Yunchengibacter salinarum TaxID=3133399 RepID=UPI0035B5B07B
MTVHPPDALGMRRRVYDFLELGGFGAWPARLFQYFMVALIVTNVAAVAMETVDDLWESHKRAFLAFEIVSLALFSLEYVARVWVSAEREPDGAVSPLRARLRYMATPMTLIDLVAILPLALLAGPGVDLRFLRIFRLLRLLKLVRYSAALATLGRAVYAERMALLASPVVMLGLLFLSAALIYFAERDVQPEAFGSIPRALWWAVATLTTVGYGDVVPVSNLGRLLGGLVMVSGLGFFALPIGIIASGFTEEIHRREFLVPTGLVNRNLLFSGLDRDVTAAIGARMRPITAAPGMVLAHRGEQETGLFLILSGEVTLFLDRRGIDLGAGDFFGDISPVRDDGVQPPAVARSRVRMLWMDRERLEDSLAATPRIAHNVRLAADRTLAALLKAGRLSEDDVARQRHWVDAALMELGIDPADHSAEHAPTGGAGQG